MTKVMNQKERIAVLANVAESLTVSYLELFQIAG